MVYYCYYVDDVNFYVAAPASSRGRGSPPIGRSRAAVEREEAAAATNHRLPRVPSAENRGRGRGGDAAMDLCTTVDWV